MTIDAVILDYGGVLTVPTAGSIAAWLEADGIQPSSFTDVLRQWLARDVPHGSPIHLLETGELPADEFERQFAAALATVHGRPVEPSGLLRRIFAEMRSDGAMIDLVREVRALGFRTALLSNSWGNSYPRQLLDEICDVVLISEEIGIRKPDPRAFQTALDKLGLTAPDRAVFVDDAEPNILAARDLGLHAVLHTDAASTRRELAKLIPALSRAEGSA